MPRPYAEPIVLIVTVAICSARDGNGRAVLPLRPGSVFMFCTRGPMAQNFSQGLENLFQSAAAGRKEHTSDTDGVTEHVFLVFCRALGFRFAPCIGDSAKIPKYLEKISSTLFVNLLALLGIDRCGKRIDRNRAGSRLTVSNEPGEAIAVFASY